MCKISMKALLLYVILITSSSGILGNVSSSPAKTEVQVKSEIPTIYVDPQNITANVGQTFNITVKIANVTNLYGIEIQLSWGSYILQYVSHKVHIPVETFPDGVLHSPIIPVKNTVNETGVPDAMPGTFYWLSYTSYGDAPTFNGSGVIFEMTFNVTREGQCDIYFTSTDLSDKEGNAITHEVRDGLFYWPGKGEIPTAKFTIDPAFVKDSLYQVFVNFSTTFNASESFDPVSGNIVLYLWNFGDGTRKSETTPITNHTYTKITGVPPDMLPNYKVLLSVINEEGSQSRIVYKEVQVIAQNPVARFETWPPTVKAYQVSDGVLAVVNEPVWFNASESFCMPGSNIALYMWDFGDGTRKNETTPITNHTYTSIHYVSPYTAKLQVMDSEGRVSDPYDTLSLKNVYVIGSRDISIADGDFTPTSIYPGQNVTITVTVQSAVTQCIKFYENFTLTAYYNESYNWVQFAEWHPETLTECLRENSTKEVTLLWVTNTSIPTGNYLIRVNVSIMADEKDVENNTWISPNPLNVISEPYRDVAVDSIQIFVSVYTQTFSLPAIKNENVTIQSSVNNKGNEEDLFNATIIVVAPNNTVIDYYSWTSLRINPGETIKLNYTLITASLDSGDYMVEVNVTTLEDNNLDNNFKNETFRIIEPPTIILAPLPSRIYENDTVTFNASASQHQNGIIEKYEWKIIDPDGRQYTREGSEISFSFRKNGTWEIELVLTDNYTITYNVIRFMTEKYRYTFRLNVEQNVAPKADFTYTPSAPRIGESVTFNATLSTPNGGNIIWYYWNFGDGTTPQNTTDKIITHVYSTVGTFTVNLTIADSFGAVNSTIKTIEVLKYLSSLTIEVSPKNVTLGEQVTINGSISFYPQRIGFNINITLRINGTVLESITINQNNFTYIWTPNNAGTYVIDAVWIGDEVSEEATSAPQTITVSVVSAPTTDITIYIISGVIVAVVILLIVLYFMKIKKKT